MKQKLRVFLTLLLCAVASVGWAEDVSVTFTMSQQGYTNGIAATIITSNGVSNSTFCHPETVKSLLLSVVCHKTSPLPFSEYRGRRNVGGLCAYSPA